MYQYNQYIAIWYRALGNTPITILYFVIFVISINLKFDKDIVACSISNTIAGTEPVTLHFWVRHANHMTKSLDC